MAPRRCLDCNQLTPTGSRCPDCRRARARARNAARPHYGADYARRAREVRENAAVCWLCGDGWRPDDPWQADHLNPGDPDSELLPAHRSCNARRGNDSRPPRGAA